MSIFNAFVYWMVVIAEMLRCMTYYYVDMSVVCVAYKNHVPYSNL